MAHHKRKKQKRKPYVGYRKVYNRNKDLNRSNKGRRNKKKVIRIQAKVKHNKYKMFHSKGWFTWGKYEKLKDATNALSSLRKNRWKNDNYEFRILL